MSKVIDIVYTQRFPWDFMLQSLDLMVLIYHEIIFVTLRPTYEILYIFVTLFHNLK
jgi:hypothetical protein